MSNYLMFGAKRNSMEDSLSERELLKTKQVCSEPVEFIVFAIREKETDVSYFSSS